jgi:hypothetical protein
MSVTQDYKILTLTVDEARAVEIAVERCERVDAELIATFGDELPATTRRLAALKSALAKVRA